jgi:hypothetical protein
MAAKKQSQTSLKRNKDSYKGNPLLKQAGVVTEFTPEELEEYAKCAEDPVYFCENYVKIVNLDQGLIKFSPREYQKTMIRTAIENRFTVAKMPRQVGKTTVVAALLLWHVLFNEFFEIAILAHKESQAIEILDRIKMAYQYLPKWLQQGVKEWNKKSIDLENNSNIIIAATSASGIRGNSKNIIYLDEFAHVPNNVAEEFFTSVYPVITAGKDTKVIITSTPRGMNLFYKIWQDSVYGNNNYKRVDIHWSMIPGKDEAWKEETIRNTSEKQFAQEFECEFLGSSSTLIDGKVLAALSHIPPINGEDTKSNIKVYRNPIPGRTYCVTVDSARGTNKDYSAFVVMDVSTFPYEVVAVYRNNLISTLVFPTPVVEVAKRYNNAMVLIETNDLGQQVADLCHRELEYEHVVWTIPGGRAGLRISQGHAKESKLGIRTSKQTKAVGCNNIKAVVEGQQIILNDFNIINELSRFALTNTGSYAAEEGNDDLAMCLVLFGWYQAQPEFRDLTNLDIRKLLQEEETHDIEEDLMPFGLLDDGVSYISSISDGVMDLPEQVSFDDWMTDNGNW